MTVFPPGGGGEPLIVEGEVNDEYAFTALAGQPTVHEAIRAYIEEKRRVIIKFDMAGELNWRECVGAVMNGLEPYSEDIPSYLDFGQLISYGNANVTWSNVEV